MLGPAYKKHPIEKYRRNSTFYAAFSILKVAFFCRIKNGLSDYIKVCMNMEADTFYSAMHYLFRNINGKKKNSDKIYTVIRKVKRNKLKVNSFAKDDLKFM